MPSGSPPRNRSQVPIHAPVPGPGHRSAVPPPGADSQDGGAEGPRAARPDIREMRFCGRQAYRNAAFGVPPPSTAGAYYIKFRNVNYKY